MYAEAMDSNHLDSIDIEDEDDFFVDIGIVFTNDMSLITHPLGKGIKYLFIVENDRYVVCLNQYDLVKPIKRDGMCAYKATILDWLQEYFNTVTLE